MAFEVSEFGGVITVGDDLVPVVKGPPEAVHTTAGAKTLKTNTTILRITGTVAVTWPGGLVENFTVLEWRGVNPGSSVTLT